MPTFLRVKRKRSEKPSDCFVVGLKRRKVQNEDNVRDIEETVFSLTDKCQIIDEKEIEKHVINKRKLLNEVQDSNAKVPRKEIPKLCLEFAVLDDNSDIKWKLLKSDESKEDDKNNLEDDQVYDYFFSDEKELDFSDFLYAKPLTEQLVEEVDSDEDSNNSEDSNDENYYLNDYPDEMTDSDGSSLDSDDFSYYENRRYENESIDIDFGDLNLSSDDDLWKNQVVFFISNFYIKNFFIFCIKLFMGGLNYLKYLNLVHLNQYLVSVFQVSLPEVD